MSLQGAIEEMGLGAVIQTLSLNRYRGTLRIETEDVGSQFFFISEGEIVLVRQVTREPVRLGDLLIRAGKISEGDLTEALSEQKRQRGTKRLGKTLADMGKISQDEIENAVRNKFEEDFLDLFLLDSGRFEFIFGLTPEALFAPDEKLERITLHTSSLMMEAMRRLDEWQGMIEGLGSLDTIYRNRTQSIGTDIRSYEFENVMLPANTREQIYELLDGTRSLREVIGTALREGIASRLETFKFLHNLNKNQLVRPMDFRTLLGEAKSALQDDDVQGAAKYIRAILGRKEKLDLGLVKRYLKFLKNQSRPRLAFDEARRFAAQCLAAGETEQAISLYEEAISLDKTVEVIDRLFYALLRANRRPRAVEVGLLLRDFLSSDAELSVAIRVCKNLKELDEDNAEVLEFSGLILKRQERNEEAVTELDLALSRIDENHPRRLKIIDALLQLQPEREDLRDEQESLELKLAQDQLAAEIRRRWLSIAGTLLLVLLIWRGYAEVRSRMLMSQYDQMVEEGLRTTLKLRNASLLLQEVHSFTTVSTRAEQARESVEAEWTKLLKEEKERADATLLASKKAREEREKAEALEARRRKFRTAMSDFRALGLEEDFEGASAKALEMMQEYGKDSDPRITRQLSKLRVYVKIVTEPAGAHVFAEGKEKSKRYDSPAVVPVPLAGKLQIRIRKPGYGVEVAVIQGDKYAVRTFTLTPGPTWRTALPAPPLAVLATEQGVVLPLASGAVSCLAYLDGKPRWASESLLAARAKEPLGGAVASGGYLIGVRGERVAALDLGTGEREWPTGKPAGTPLPLAAGATLLPPVAASIRGRAVVLVGGGTDLFLLNAATGKVRLHVTGLPAPVVHPPAAGQNWAFVPLRDRVVAFSMELKGAQGKLAWSKVDADRRWVATGIRARGAPFYFDGSVWVPQREGFKALRSEDGVVEEVLPRIGPIHGVSPGKSRLFCLGTSGSLCTVTSEGVLDTSPGPVVPTVSGGPALLGRDVFVVDGKGRLFRLGPDWKKRRGVAPIKLGKPLTHPLRVRGKSIVAVTGDQVSLIEPTSK